MSLKNPGFSEKPGFCGESAACFAPLSISRCETVRIVRIVLKVRAGTVDLTG